MLKNKKGSAAIGTAIQALNHELTGITNKHDDLHKQVMFVKIMNAFCAFMINKDDDRLYLKMLNVLHYILATMEDHPETLNIDDALMSGIDEIKSLLTQRIHEMKG